MSIIYYFPEKYKIIPEQIDNIDINNVKLMLPEHRKCTICYDKDKNKYLKFNNRNIIYSETNMKYDKSIIAGYYINCNCLNEEYSDHSIFFNQYEQSMYEGICGNCFMQRCYCYNNESVDCSVNCIRCGSDKWMTIKELNYLIIENNKFKLPSKKKKNTIYRFSRI